MSDSVKLNHLFTIGSAPLTGSRNPAQQTQQSSQFRDLLQQKVLKFSQHAEVRMKQRGIQLQPETIAKIANAIDEAETKGAVDSLIVMKDITMIVNVPSRTVVTAMDGRQMKSSVFTNIDSAVILN